MKFVHPPLFSRLALVRSLVECDASGCELKNYLRGPWPDRKKIKVVSREAHTMTKFACPNSGSDTGEVVISTASFNSISSVVVDKSSMTASTPPGIMLGELMDLLAVQGVTLHPPAGMVSTGAHGSSLWSRGGGTYEYLVSMRIVVPASVRSMTKRSVTLSVADDASLEDNFLRLAREHEFGQVLWYSSQKKYVWRTDDRAPLSVAGNGAETTPLFLPNTVNTITSTVGGLFNDEQQQHFSGRKYFHKFQARGGCQYTYSNSTNLALPVSKRLVCGWEFRTYGLFWFHVSVSISIGQLYPGRERLITRTSLSA
ncbi:hypothetical protein SELMODRAFT_403566 [Selaginella moellendorffii]|uniref:FAD-binding PCMH-type domain-containing protein n=1 Tax=Selaginella moellendorffii TaxID=88036 RepID=D8QRT8_SELML|nr:hypothetical protein SELMODRAFT_403566 [Selaginella moellendorffii]